MKNKKIEENKLNLEDVEKIIANPFYCIDVSPRITGEHKKMITEKEWIKVGMIKIKQDNDGGEKFLTSLLENLKGNFV